MIQPCFYQEIAFGGVKSTVTTKSNTFGACTSAQFLKLIQSFNFVYPQFFLKNILFLKTSTSVRSALR